MKIESIYVNNLFGAAAVEVATQAPVQLFVGPNGAGKTSLSNAVALALTGDLSRVTSRKKATEAEAAHAIREGAEVAQCSVVTSDGDKYSVSISPSGKIIGKPAADPVLAYLLDATRFARADDTERREFLFQLMGLKTDAKAIIERLRRRGLDAARVERIAPLLRSGCDAGHKEAKAKATEAKGAWRAVTGETYGSEKAKTWRAEVPTYDEANMPTLATELKHCDVALGSWQQQIGALKAEQRRRAGLQAKLPALLEHAGRVDRIRAKLANDERSLAEWESDLAKTVAAAGAGPRVGLVHDLAVALGDMVSKAGKQNWNDKYPEQFQRGCDALDAYEREHGKIGATGGDDKARARLPSIQKSRDLMANAVANDRRDLDAALAAQAEAQTIEADLAAPTDAAGLADAEAQAAALQQTRQQLIAQLDKQKALKAEAEAAAKKTEAAAAHAADVAAWDRISEALAPDGIPGEILAEALGPLNGRLEQAALDTEWPQVRVAADMAITAAGRDYKLLSESERWRADAMLAEAIAHLSGARLLVLDRFDVLDQPARGQLLGWLDTLAGAGELDTALVFGTLKGAPTGLPDTIQAHWIENGVCGQLKAAA